MTYPTEKIGDHIAFSNGKASPDRRPDGRFPVHGSNGVIGRADESNAPAQTTIIGRVGSYCGSLHFSRSASWVTDNAIKAIPRRADEARFWFYALSTADLAALRSGSGQPLINQGSLNTLKVPLPPHAQRLAIGDLLGSLDDKIELNRRMNETLEAMAQAIFRDWFVDFGPVRRKLAGATDPVEIMGGMTTDADRAAELAGLFPETLGDDEAPVGWVPQRLDELATLSRAGVNPLSFPEEAFEHYSLPAYDDGQEPVLDAGETIKSNKALVPVGSVLLSKLNPDIPRVWLPNPPGEMRQVASTEFLVFEPQGGIGRALLYFLFKDRTVRQTLESMVTGTSKSHQRVSPPALLQSTLLVASDPCAAAFGEIAEPIIERCLALRAENRTLTETRDYLLPRLMSGEVRVGDATREIAA